MEKSDKKILEDMFKILIDELVTNKKVSIGNFGKFYLSSVLSGFDSKKAVTTVRFRPFKVLKKSVNAVELIDERMVDDLSLADIAALIDCSLEDLVGMSDDEIRILLE